MDNTYIDNNISKLFFPRILRRYRDRAGLSQRQLADAVGISKSYISSLELGYRCPNLNLLIVIANVLNVRPGELVDAMVQASIDEGFDIPPNGRNLPR